MLAGGGAGAALCLAAGVVLCESTIRVSKRRRKLRLRALTGGRRRSTGATERYFGHGSLRLRTAMETM